MNILILGLVIFFAVHLVPSFVSIKQNLVNQLGEMRFKAIYSALSAIGFITIITGMVYSEDIHLWTPPIWGKHLAMTMMLPAIILLVCANMPSNIKRFTRHPMLWGTTFWAFAHLLANGDMASLLLFGSFALFSLFAMWSGNRRGATKSSRGYPLSQDLKVVAIGFVLYGILLFAHPYFTGMSLVALPV